MKFIYHLFRLGYKLQQWLVKRFTPAGLGILICLMITLIVGIDTKQTTTYQILTFLLAVLIIAVAFSFYFPGRFTIQRNLPKFATVGTKLFYRVTIANKSKKVQTRLLFIEEIAHPKFSLAQFKRIIKAASKKGSFHSLIYIYYRWSKSISRQKRAKATAIAIPDIKPQGTIEIKGQITPTHRGVVRLKGVTILRPDPFNLFNATKTISQPRSLLVLPKRYQLPTIQLPGSRMSQSGSMSQVASKGDSEEFIALRDYRPGDPLRKIHWKSWAKTGKPIVKVEQSEFYVRQALILDTFQSTHSEILEEAIAVAASFACDFQTQESLLDLMFVGLDSYSFPSDRGFDNSEQMLEVLAGVTPCQDTTCDRLISVVSQKASMLSGCICILISWDEQRQKLINYLQKLNIPLLIFLIAEEGKYQDLNLENLYILPLDKIQAALMTINTKY